MPGVQSHHVCMCMSFVLCDTQAKALYTKLLLILTRCSRLLVTEQEHFFATEPRNKRYPAGLSFTTQSKGKTCLSPTQLCTHRDSTLRRQISF